MSTTTATEKPILFSAPMIRALLEGRKTMTRRVVKFPAWAKGRPLEFDEYGLATTFCGDVETHAWLPCPFAKVVPYVGNEFRPHYEGHRLWVRETWRACDDNRLGACVEYRADNVRRKPKFPSEEDGWKCEQDASAIDAHHWRPSIFMPRWASRITLEITSVKVERVQSISEADAQAEGLTEYFWDDEAKELPQIKPQIEAGQRWWNHVIVKRSRRGSVWDCPIKAFRELWNDINGKGSWEANPWVWVVCFRRNDA